MRSIPTLVLILSSGAIAQTVPISMIAHTDRAYSSMPAGATFQGFINPPVLSLDGQAAVYAPLNPPEGDALCIETPAGPRVLTRAGDIPPGMPGGVTVYTMRRPVALGGDRVASVIHVSFNWPPYGHSSYYVASPA